jgi:sugar lactone lactonase YvrE
MMIRIQMANLVFDMKKFMLFLTALALAQTSLLAQLPVITNQPTSQAVWAGANVAFAVGVTGTGPFTYQWQRNTTNVPASIITTFAGGGVGDGGPGTNAALWSPSGVAVDAVGNVFIADQGNNRIRKLATNGVITTVAGNGLDIAVSAAIRQKGGALPKLGSGTGTYSGDGGPATNASLYGPEDVVVDAAGNLYIADSRNNRIRKVDTNGIITTIAGNGTATFAGDGGQATNASLSRPSGLAFDVAGNLFIADDDNSVVRKVGVNGIISTVAGTNGYAFSGDGGAATNSGLSGPYGVALDARGNLFIADDGNQRIRKVDTNGIITTVAGTNTYGFFGDGGAATNAALWNPCGLAVDAAGNLFIADESNSRIRKLGTNGIITTVAGTNSIGVLGDGGLAVNSNLNNPLGVALDAAGNIFIADAYNSRLRKVNTNGIINTIAGNGTISYCGDDGPAIAAGLSTLGGITMDPGGNVFVTDTGNARIRKVGTNGLITTVAGNGIFTFSGDNVAATNTSLDYPTSVAADAHGNLYIADESNNRIRKVNASGIISTVAGTNSSGFGGDGGPATNAILSGPSGVALDALGNLFIADASNERVRKVDTNGIITTVAGNGAKGIYLTGTYSGDNGPATNAGLANPSSVTVDAAGNLFISDSFNYRIRKVDTHGTITTIAGNGAYPYAGDGVAATNTSVGITYGLQTDSSGNLFFADSSCNRVREVNTGGIISTVAGNGSAAFAGDGGAATNASLDGPYGVVVDNADNLFIADSGNLRIRKVTNIPPGPVLALTNVTPASAGDYQLMVSDSSGSVTSSVAVLVVASTPLIYQAERGSNGSLVACFVSPPGSTNVVFAATNLTPPVDWLPLGTNLAGANGDWQFTDTNTAGHRARFYRSLTPPP